MFRRSRFVSLSVPPQYRSPFTKNVRVRTLAVTVDRGFKCVILDIRTPHTDLREDDLVRVSYIFLDLCSCNHKRVRFPSTHLEITYNVSAKNYTLLITRTHGSWRDQLQSRWCTALGKPRHLFRKSLQHSLVYNIHVSQNRVDQIEKD